LEKYVCIHGHFYQPPRENPWLETVEQQESAYPYHDWNERITAECYAPNAASAILDHNHWAAGPINNYSKISFNFGPTLLSWMQKHKTDVYQAILDADRISRERFSGHGSAIAQIYNHMIMPLASRRDKKTQAIWGIRDFQKRFGRFPEGMWLPETAVDLETLEVLAELNIKFTILSPHQIQKVKEIGFGEWQDVSGGRIDPSMVYLCCLPSGRSINIFVYDGLISQAVAFGDLLNNGESFANKLLGAVNHHRDRPQIVHIATDGETYGHYRRQGNIALASCLGSIDSSDSAVLTNYGQYLQKHPPTHMIAIVENSSWSCAHGIERWRADCGCHSGMHSGWTQAWRKPLREAMDCLRDRVAAIYDKEAALQLRDPWEARDDYIELMLNRSTEHVERFFARHLRDKLATEEEERVIKLLEMQKNAMLVYTSCGWFFDDIAGIEAVQVMRYAAKAMQLAEEVQGIPLEPDYIRLLEKAPSNVHENGARTYDLLVKAARMEGSRVIAG
jgi:alpha-amylase/alpha-mannosidase (GH57 family)